MCWKHFISQAKHPSILERNRNKCLATVGTKSSFLQTGRNLQHNCNQLCVSGKRRELRRDEMDVMSVPVYRIYTKWILCLLRSLLASSNKLRISKSDTRWDSLSLLTFSRLCDDLTNSSFVRKWEKCPWLKKLLPLDAPGLVSGCQSNESNNN